MLTLIGQILTACRAVRAADKEINFNRDGRPILSDKCFHCHGPDEASRMAELRLDDEASTKVNRDGVVVISPHDSAGSELIRRILSNDEFEIMPPRESQKPLSENEKQILQRWIAEGAKWSRHWAYESPVRSEAPVVKQSGWPRNWVDNFILSLLEL